MFFSPETADFSPETADFCIDIPEDGSETSSSLGDGINEMEDPHKLDPENKPKHLKQHRGFLDVMDTMNIKFGYNDGKLSASLDLISLYLKGQKLLYLEAMCNVKARLDALKSTGGKRKSRRSKKSKGKKSKGRKSRTGRKTKRRR